MAEVACVFFGMGMGVGFLIGYIYRGLYIGYPKEGQIRPKECKHDQPDTVDHDTP